MRRVRFARRRGSGWGRDIFFFGGGVGGGFVLACSGVGVGGEAGYGWRGGRCGRERHMGRVRFARLRGSGRGGEVFFGGGVGSGFVLACSGVGVGGEGGFGRRGGRSGRERHMGRVRFARLRGSGRGRDIFFGGGVGGGGVLACGGVGAAADFEELFVDLGGGEVGEGVEVGILRGGGGEL